ncbi:hypothetical protein RRG08_002877, partial [Elysia crispata]
IHLCQFKYEYLGQVPDAFVRFCCSRICCPKRLSKIRSRRVIGLEARGATLPDPRTKMNLRASDGEGEP